MTKSETFLGSLLVTYIELRTSLFSVPCTKGRIPEMRLPERHIELTLQEENGNQQDVLGRKCEGIYFHRHFTVCCL